MANAALFTEREQDVIALLLEGRSNKQIALALGIANRTVEYHLKNIYIKLGVSSRVEAVLKLSSTSLREATGPFTDQEQGKSTIDGFDRPAENGPKTIPGRLSMRNLFYVSSGVLLLVLLALAFARSTPRPEPDIPTAGDPAAPSPSPPATPTESSSHSKEHILDKIHQLAAEYEQNVQAEKKNGRVESSQDPQTGGEIFIFMDESYARIDELYSDFMFEKTRLEDLYTQLYRDELQPTPFPTIPAGHEQAAYDSYAAQAASYCSLESWQNDPDAERLLVYQPDEGKYQEIFMGAVIARCNLFGQMWEENRTARVMARVDQNADRAAIELALGQPSPTLVFDSIQSLANAPGRSAAIYTDNTGTKYYVDVESGRLAQIEPNFPTHPQISNEMRLKIEDLRSIAEAFALKNSPRLETGEPTLLYEEGNKGDIYFFRWDARNQDWSGTDWAMMPPFLQVGLLADGQVVIYLNTLDLAVE